MTIRMMLAGVAAAGLMAFPAMADDGQYGPPLRQMLADAAEGSCNEGLMAPGLLNACQGQIAGMAPGLQALGAIESMTFVNAQDTPDGRVETWSVKFAGGQTRTWFIGQQQPDGRFNAAGTGG
jgi:hypothetical protein